jgi:exosortase/archaeosortase family protein
MTDAAPRPAPGLDRTTVGLGLLLGTLAAFTTWDQWAIWSTKDDYTFGYLVPLFAGYVVWDRWAESRPLLTGERGFVSGPSHPWVVRGAGLGAFGALLIFTFGTAGRIMYGTGPAPTVLMAGGLTTFALCLAFLSARGPDDTAPAAAARWRLTGLALFPASIWLISGPFLYLVDNRIKLELLSNVTELVSGFLRAADQTIRVSGNTIIFANGDAVGVADACSGIRSLSACVFAGAFLAALFLEGGPVGRLLRGAAMLALSAGVALLLNIGRNTYLAFHALQHGSKSLDADLAGIPHGQPGFSALGTVHDLAGNVAMGLALLLLLCLLPLLNRLGRGERGPPPA